MQSQDKAQLYSSHGLQMPLQHDAMSLSHYQWSPRWSRHWSTNPSQPKQISWYIINKLSWSVVPWQHGEFLQWKIFAQPQFDFPRVFHNTQDLMSEVTDDSKLALLALHHCKGSAHDSRASHRLRKPLSLRLQQHQANFHHMIDDGYQLISMSTKELTTYSSTIVIDQIA